MNGNDLAYLICFTIIGLFLLGFGIMYKKEAHADLKNSGVGGNGVSGIGAILFFLPHWVYKAIFIALGAFLTIGIWYVMFFYNK
ncbi:hypothetical protein ACFWM3_02965 [Gottfriedia sp. NPDC058432]|uniref:hypothetical protein n=1 Tax=Gottfriedia sp. NPDC058432 TaxID=3346497 RepID=UPI003649AB4B